MPMGWSGVVPGTGGGGGGGIVKNLSAGTGTFTETAGKIVGGMWDGFDLYDPGGNFVNIVGDGSESALNTAVQGSYFRPAYEKGDRFDNEALCLTLDAIGDWTVELKMKSETSSATTTHMFTGPGAHWARGNDSAFAITCATPNSTKVFARVCVGLEEIGKTEGATLVDPTEYWFYKTQRLGKDIIYAESVDGITWTVIRTAEDDVVGSFTKIGLVFGNWTSYTARVTIEAGRITYTAPP
jgi:hypothetical protein